MLIATVPIKRSILASPLSQLLESVGDNSGLFTRTFVSLKTKPDITITWKILSSPKPFIFKPWLTLQS